MKKSFFKGKNMKKRLLFTICIVIVLSPLLITFSRYIMEKTTEHYLDSKSFYFTSDVLNGSTYNLYNWNGHGDYSFNIDIKNSKDNLNWSQTDINYTYNITCTKDSQPITCTNNSTGVLTYNRDEKTSNIDTITIVKGENTFNSGDIITVVVEASSISPYAKALNATFNFQINDIGVSYQIQDEQNSLYLTLLIANNNSNKNVSITFDPTVINIDNTNANVINGTTNTNENNLINNLIISTISDTVYSIRFYKNNKTQNYSMSQTLFSIE